jgi:arginyl-tRNA synthetase
MDSGSPKRLINDSLIRQCMNKFVQEIKKELKKAGVKAEISLEVPPDNSMGDYAFPCFPLAREWKKSPNEIAEDIAKKV